MSALREAAQQALEALEWHLERGAYGADIEGVTGNLRAALAQPVPHGCHVYPHLGMKPDGCVLDDGRPENCIYAKRLLREGKDKTACVYWQPIEVTR